MTTDTTTADRPHTTHRSKTRTARAEMYAQIRKQLAAVGYDTMRPIYLDRWQAYRLIVIAVNKLAAILGKQPYRVYKSLLARVYLSARGQHFRPESAGTANPDALAGRGEMSVICPHCHRDMLDGGPLTKDEVTAERKTHKSPHIAGEVSAGGYGDSVSGPHNPGPEGQGAGTRGGGSTALSAPFPPDEKTETGISVPPPPEVEG